jgi:hypothetical protein
MKIGRSSIAGASVALLVIQLTLVSSIAAKYFYQRWRCPRVWTRAAAYDPEMVLRGRYLSLQLTVDGCQSTLPSASQAKFPRDINGAAIEGRYAIQGRGSVQFPAELKVEDGKLLAVRISDEDESAKGQTVSAQPGSPCEAMKLVDPVDFFIAEHAASPLPMKAGQELWIEVTVPPKGAPRPIQLAVKQDGVWKPLAFE